MARARLGTVSNNANRDRCVRAHGIGLDSTQVRPNGQWPSLAAGVSVFATHPSLVGIPAEGLYVVVSGIRMGCQSHAPGRQHRRHLVTYDTDGTPPGIAIPRPAEEPPELGLAGLSATGRARESDAQRQGRPDRRAAPCPGSRCTRCRTPGSVRGSHAPPARTSDRTSPELRD